MPAGSAMSGPSRGCAISLSGDRGGAPPARGNGIDDVSDAEAAIDAYFGFQ
jgi:hypothetical protein